MDSCCHQAFRCWSVCFSSIVRFILLQGVSRPGPGKWKAWAILNPALATQCIDMAANKKHRRRNSRHCTRNRIDVNRLYVYIIYMCIYIYIYYIYYICIWKISSEPYLTSCMHVSACPYQLTCVTLEVRELLAGMISGHASLGSNSRVSGWIVMARSARGYCHNTIPSGEDSDAVLSWDN